MRLTPSLRGRFGRALCALLIVLGGCQDRDDGVHGTSAYNRPIGEVPDGCIVPQEGCACEEVGSYVDCGDVEIRSGDYVTCSMGKRRCQIDATWSGCVGDQTTIVYDPEASRKTLAVTGPSVCVGNSCDPYCYVTEDDGVNVPDLPEGTCQATDGGIVLCQSSCGYAGPHGRLGYEGLPDEWQRAPASCSEDADACGYDSRCSDSGVCARWGYPCYDPAPPNCTLAKKVDLQLGPPCKSATGNTYHFQVCNRGSDTADSGVVKIGVYTDRAKITTDAFTMANPGPPDAGSVSVTLSDDPGRSIAPGQCLHVTPGNSTATPNPLVGLSGVRALAINYDTSFAECNLRNNWTVFDATDSCTDCTGLQCNQTCAETILTGRIMDPRGDTGDPDTSGNPVVGAIVYVPNEAVSELRDGVSCDTCSSLISGTPITSAVTGGQGTFTLPNVPDSTPFKLVIQTGKWRRQVDIDPILPCNTVTLPPDKARLPRNKTEGDIPRMAIMMSAGDHLQCLMRKIGIDDAEFTDRTGDGRIHLYAFNGMRLPTTNCRNPANGTCGNDLLSSPIDLDKYSAVIAPCDKNPFGGSPSAQNPYYGSDSAGQRSGYAQDPYPNSYGYTSFAEARAATYARNTTMPPFPTHPDVANSAVEPRLSAPTAAQIANLKNYIDKGGRLFATHWMAYFLTATSYPGAVNYDFGDYVDRDRGPPDFPFAVDTSSEIGATFVEWLDSSTLTFKRWRHLSRSVNAPAISLASGDSRNAPVSHPNCSGTGNGITPASCSTAGWGGPQVPALQFDTPWGVPAAEQCGRVVIAQSHVSESDSTTSQQGIFPGACADGIAMSGEERAFEFMLFSTTQCIGTVAPPQPPATPLEQATVSFDYDSDCREGSQPEWQFFSWQATVPSLTSIQFRARTAETQADLDQAPDVGVGTATTSTTTWTSDSQTVEQHLNASDPQLSSRKWLRISATLNPSSDVSPRLQRWRQTFDCIPAE
jgi:hypothetical protein